MHFAFHANIRSHCPPPHTHTSCSVLARKHHVHSFHLIHCPWGILSLQSYRGDCRIDDLVDNACLFSSWFLKQSFNRLYGSRTFRIVISLRKQICVCTTQVKISHVTSGIMASEKLGRIIRVYSWILYICQCWYCIVRKQTYVCRLIMRTVYKLYGDLYAGKHP